MNVFWPETGENDQHKTLNNHHMIYQFIVEKSSECPKLEEFQVDWFFMKEVPSLGVL